MQNVYLAIVLAPLVAAAAAGLFGKTIGRAGRAHGHDPGRRDLVRAVGRSCSTASSTARPPTTPCSIDGRSSAACRSRSGFLVDHLTALMMAVVTFVSLAVHVYTIGYMHDDPGYQRFFSYISLFTFSMLMLVMSNNFLQLFFGWEAVGVVSYLLIGFWYTRPTATFASLKAFLVNRVGDFGFLLGIAALATYTGTLDYALTFERRRPPCRRDEHRDLLGHPLVAAHVRVHLPLHRRDGQVRAGAAARVAAGFDGRARRRSPH